MAWARRSEAGRGQWLRWQSPPLLTRSALDLAWQKAQVWAQTPSEDDLAREVRTVALDQWQIFYFRGNAWSNPLSSAGSADSVPVATPSASAGVLATVPDGVRLVLTLSPGQAINGTLTRDCVRGSMRVGQ